MGAEELLLPLLLPAVLLVRLPLLSLADGCRCISQTRARHNQAVPNVHVAEPRGNCRAVAGACVFTSSLGVYL